MAALAEYLRFHQRLYYVDRSPVLSDRTFDRLLSELQALETAHPDLAPHDSPTRSVGSDLEGDFKRFEHRIRVLSLSNTYSTAEAMDWANRTGATQFNVQWKVDGATLVLYYEKGRLTHGVTRGTGNVGDDITANARTIRSVPEQLNEPVNLIARGEAYMSYPDFERFNEESGSIYANPRNLTAGSLKQKKPAMVAKRPIRWTGFDLHFLDEPDASVQTDTLALRRASELGLPVFEENTSVTLDDLQHTIEEFRKRSAELDFPVDGLVLKVDDRQLRAELGFTAASPRWAVALKFEPELAETTVEEIEVFVGRTGRVTPRARLKPVSLAGTTVTYATLHNADFVARLDVRPGARVIVSKRGEIIPAVEEVVDKGTGPAFEFPGLCPACKTKLLQEEDVVDRYCPNPECDEKLIHALIFFCGRKQMDMAGLGEKTLRALFQAGLIRYIEDIFALEEKREQMETLDGFGKKSVDSILAGIAEARRKNLRRLLPSLGLREIGPSVTDILIREGYRSIEALFSLVDSKEAEKTLQEIHGIGPETAGEIIRQLKDRKLRKRIRMLQEGGLRFEMPAETEANGPELPAIFAGQTWCVTGTFAHFRPREKAMEEVERRGGRTTSSVSAKTTHLLAGESAGSKLAKAEKLGVTIVNEDDFRTMLGAQTP